MVSCQAVPERSGIPPPADEWSRLVGDELTKPACRWKMVSPTTVHPLLSNLALPAGACLEAHMSISAVADRVIELAMTIQAPPERVFGAFTQQALLESWFVRRAEVDPRPGGTFGCFWSTAQVVGTFL
jgi:hypothetical protein